MNARIRDLTVEVTRWEWPGDHPSVVTYPFEPYGKPCSKCGENMSRHGKFDGDTVCPGMSIVANLDGTGAHVVDDATLARYYVAS